jgi:hypothetical protein
MCRQIATTEPMDIPPRVDPVVVLEANSWNKMTQHGLRFALRLSDDIYVVQVKTETTSVEQLSCRWEPLIANPARKNRIAEPRLVVLTSEYRQFLSPFVNFVKKLEGEHPDRDIAVVIPDLVVSHWYEGVLLSHRGAFLRAYLRAECSDRVVVISVPFHLRD